MLMFVVFPAIDLLDGKVVRLKQGRYDAVKFYSDEPGKTAQQFEQEGASWLHVVDLNGAKEGEPKNWEALKAVRKSTQCSIQFGGGVRSLPILERLFTLGVQRVVMGTSAIRNPFIAYEAVKAFGEERIAVAVDVRDGKVAVQGWTETEPLSPSDVGRKLRETGVVWFVYTDILRDGTLTSPNFEAIAQFAETVQGKIIASGGISDIEHVRRLKEMQTLGVVGCIIGSAIYEGKLNLREVLRVAEDS